MMGVENDNLINVFNQWARELIPKYKNTDCISIDGKSIRSTLTDSFGNKQNFASIVSWFSQESGLVLALEKLENKKTSEIHCVQDMVKNLPLENQVFTLDAVHCQKETVQGINESNNDYLIAVKKTSLNCINS